PQAPQKPIESLPAACAPRTCGIAKAAVAAAVVARKRRRVGLCSGMVHFSLCAELGRRRLLFGRQPLLPASDWASLPRPSLGQSRQAVRRDFIAPSRSILASEDDSPTGYRLAPVGET